MDKNREKTDMDVVQGEGLGPPLIVNYIQQSSLNLHLAVHFLKQTGILSETARHVRFLNQPEM